MSNMAASYKCISPNHNLVIVNDTTKGNCLFTKKSFKAGDIICTNKPISHVLLNEFMEERCSYCFMSCKNIELFQCSRCQYIQYCSKICQKSHYKQHQEECKLMSKMQECKDVVFTQEVRLLLMVFLALHPIKSNKKTPIRVECSTDDMIFNDADELKHLQSNSKAIKNSNAAIMSTCGTTHVLNLCHSNHTSSDMKDIIHTAYQLLVQIYSNKEVSSSMPTYQECLTMLQKFRCNNFGIMNELLQCIGAGIYPCVALLNHSCVPNCVLRYHIVENAPVCLQVVALYDIAPGTELTHSYVDQVEDTSKRRNKLRSTYGFVCGEHCGRCFPRTSPQVADELAQVSGGELLDLTARYKATGSYEYILKALSKGLRKPTHLNSGGNVSSEADLEVCFGAALPDISPSVYASTVQEAHALLQNSIALDDLEMEIQLLKKAICLLERVCVPFNMELYHIYGKLMTCSLLQHDFKNALEYCYKVVGFLYRVFDYSGVTHPLMGLQLFTLGDILLESNQDVYASMAYHESLSILSVTHGTTDSDMVHRLKERLEMYV